MQNEKRMYLKFIDRGTAMQIQQAASGAPSGTTYKASFYDFSDDTAFFAESEALYKDFEACGENTLFNITFGRGDDMYMFTGRAKRAVLNRGSYLTLIEQWSDILFQSRRSDDRNEMRVSVRFYGLSEENMKNGVFQKSDEQAEFTAETFDISAGGLCMVSNEYLDSKHEPYFLAEFTLNGGKSEFLLPVRLIRKGNCPQTALYRYDYGLLFVYDRCQEEKGRLSAALTDTVFREKLSKLNRF
ncbi:MAG: hypothetical protein LBT12_06430 [Oscillospiraceae bacterium]|jgi:hypothetical protein|nr:hypothetical protein [Oscillospiraceae bacterium]